jgi:hypothetical protein
MDGIPEAPDYGLIESDPQGFREQFREFVAAAMVQQGRAGALDRVNQELRAALDAANEQVQAAEQAAQAQREAAEAQATRLNLAVAAYRQALLNGDPSLPPELVQGETVEEVDASLAKAQGVVEFVRRRVAEANGAGGPGPIAPPAVPRVPGGAPGRTLPDVAAMSAREKLIFGTSRGA